MKTARNILIIAIILAGVGIFGFANNVHATDIYSSFKAVANNNIQQCHSTFSSDGSDAYFAGNIYPQVYINDFWWTAAREPDYFTSAQIHNIYRKFIDQKTTSLFWATAPGVGPAGNYSPGNNAVIGNVTASTNGSNLLVTGDASPDCSGTYTPDGGGSYKRTDGVYYIWWDADINIYVISQIKNSYNVVPEKVQIPIALSMDGTYYSFYSGLANPGFYQTGDPIWFLPMLMKLYYDKTGDTTNFTSDLAILKNVLSHVPRNGTDKLISVSAPWVTWGFEDNVKKTGDDLFGSLFYYQASLDMAALYTAIGDTVDATYYTNEAADIKNNINTLWDSTDGMFYAASGNNHQIDIMGSAYASYIGITSSAQDTAISIWLVANINSIVNSVGFFRESPTNWAVAWSPTFHPGSYDNGYWSIANDWILDSIKKTNSALALSIATNFANGAHPTEEYYSGDGVTPDGATVNMESPMATLKFLRENLHQVTDFSASNATDKSAYKANLSWIDQGQTGVKIEEDANCTGVYGTTLYDNSNSEPSVPYQVTGLSANTCYNFEIFSYNSDGTITLPSTVQFTIQISADATLGGLTISQGILTLTGTNSYTGSVGNNITSVTVTPTATQANATIKVNGTTVASGSASGLISLNVGSNTITIVVTAQDGVTTDTYTIVVTRAVATAVQNTASAATNIGSGGNLLLLLNNNAQKITPPVASVISTRQGVDEKIAEIKKQLILLLTQVIQMLTEQLNSMQK